MKRKPARFGGDWTTQKLEVVKKYLSAYTTALKKQPFKTAYIDAFAGTGYRERKDELQPGELLFPDLALPEPQQFLDGSARIALQTEPRFHKYIFVERNPERCAQLEEWKVEFPALAQDIEIRNEEANSYMQDLRKRGWGLHRAVMFLDPFGMQVEWASLEVIAETEAIDLWVLFPLGIGVNRLLKRDANIKASWRKRLDVLLGTTDWFDAFYTTKPTRTILGEEQEETVKTASTEVIGKFFLDRLKTVFAAVAPNPRVLTNSKNCPLYLLCFAVGNPKGATIAVKIAKHILES